MKDSVQYSEELANEILDTIASAEVGIRKLCAANPHWPTAKTIMAWKRSHSEFGERYARAKQDQIELIIDDVLEISDDRSRDVIIKQDKDGNDYEVCNHEFIQRSRVRIDTRKWLAAKLLPKLYGDKIQIDKNDPSTDEDLIRAKLIASQLQGEDNGRSDEPKS